MRTIAENKIRDELRRRREQQAPAGVLSAQADSDPGPSEIWERHWFNEHLRYCVEQVRPDVSENTYQAFYQTVIEGRPVKVVAERLGISLNQVYVAKFRVMERVRGMLADLTGSDFARLLT